MAVQTKPQRGIGAIETGSRILTAFVTIGRPAMLRDLAEHAGLTAAQAHAYLVSFKSAGLVEQEDGSGLYRLGPTALNLGLVRLRTHEPLRMASSAIVGFSTEQAAMVALSVWGTYGPTIIQVQEGPHQLHVNVRAGTVFSITGTATGRVFAAHLPESLIAERVAAERTDRATQRIGQVTTLTELKKHTAFIRRHGFAPIEGQPVPGVNAIAAPVRDYTGQLQCVVTMIAAAGMLDTGTGGARARAMLAFAGKLSSDLGYRAP